MEERDKTEEEKGLLKREIKDIPSYLKVLILFIISTISMIILLFRVDDPTGDAGFAPIIFYPPVIFYSVMIIAEERMRKLVRKREGEELFLKEKKFFDSLFILIILFLLSALPFLLLLETTIAGLIAIVGIFILYLLSVIGFCFLIVKRILLFRKK